MEPLPVIPLQYAHVGVTMRSPKLLLGFTIAAWLSCVAAWVLIVFYEIESVIVTGPLITAMGILLMIVAIRDRAMGHVFLATAHIAICVLLWMLVILFHWSPQAAFDPFVIIGAAYIAGSGIASARLAQKTSRRQPGLA